MKRELKNLYTRLEALIHSYAIYIEVMNEGDVEELEIQDHMYRNIMLTYKEFYDYNMYYKDKITFIKNMFKELIIKYQVSKYTLMYILHSDFFIELHSINLIEEVCNFLDKNY